MPKNLRADFSKARSAPRSITVVVPGAMHKQIERLAREKDSQLAGATRLLLERGLRATPSLVNSSKPR